MNLIFCALLARQGIAIENADLRHAVIAEVNRYRQERNLGLVKSDFGLMKVAWENLNEKGVSVPRNLSRAIVSFSAVIDDPNIIDIGVAAKLNEKGEPKLYIEGRSSSDPHRVVINQDAFSTFNSEVKITFRSSMVISSVRISEDGQPFGEWSPYSPIGNYKLKGGTGLRFLNVQIRDIQGRTVSLVDSIYFNRSEVMEYPWGTSNDPKPQNPGLLEVKPDVFKYPLIFPMLGKVRWSDTWGAPRGGGTRKHIGQDLPAEKMRPILACADGVFLGGGLSDDFGAFFAYYHLNNDSPGTDDGKGGDIYAFAPGVYPGMRVYAGQHIAYNGDSGNAEETVPHLHFELHLKDIGVVNAYESLMNAEKLAAPRYKPEFPELLPKKGEIRWDAQIQKISDDGTWARVNIAAKIDENGKVTPSMKLDERVIDLKKIWYPLEKRMFLALIGKDLSKKESFKLRAIQPIRKPK